MRATQMKMLFHFLFTSLFVVAPLANFQPSPVVRAKAADPATLKSAVRQTVVVRGPDVSPAVTPGISPPVRDLPLASVWQAGDPVREQPARQNQSARPDGGLPESGFVDPLLQSAQPNTGRTPAPLLSFDGIGSTGFVPPDIIGDVGPNHYVQMVNVSFAIYNKSGTLLTGPTDINMLWAGQGNACDLNNDGDPVVLYDPLADRWLLAQFAVPNPYYICIAISQTPDPTGAYYLYQFQMTGFPDYPKFGVWPDAYYMSTNEANAAAYAFDRSAMLAGAAASSQKFTTSGNFMLPSDLDGPTPPPPGAPNYFYTLMDDTFWGGGPDRLEIWEFHVDWTTPANSTFTLGPSLPTAAFIYTVCGFFVLNCIPQPTPGELVDAISEWPMWRFAYRNFGAYQALVGNFAVDVDNANHSGIRWFELRNSGAGWSLYQEGTHAPDAHHRWLGSIAMDQDGNIALGYSVSSASLLPAIRYATRLVSDPLGTLQAEQTLIAGGGVQTNGANRWGDYSAMSVDPVDECTFWYTNEYYQATSARSWSTRIGSFKIPSCGGTDLSLVKTDTPDPVIAGQPLTYTLTIDNLGPSPAANVVLTDTLPASVLFASASATQGICQETSGTVVCDVGALAYPGSATASIIVTPTLGGVITNNAIVTSDGADPDPANNTQVITTTVQAQADLALSKTGAPDPVQAGGLLTYTLSVQNNGPSNALGVVVTDTLPVTLTFASASPGCAPLGLTVACSLGAVTAGSSEAVTITASVDPGYSGVLTNSAETAALTDDPNAANNSATESVTVSPVADLELVKTAAPDPVKVSAMLTYTLVITNHGPAAAANIILTDTLPSDVSYLQASPGCAFSTNLVLCTLTALASGSSASFEIIVQVGGLPGEELNNIAEVRSSTADPDLNNNIAHAITSIQWQLWLPYLSR